MSLFAIYSRKTIVRSDLIPAFCRMLMEANKLLVYSWICVLPHLDNIGNLPVSTWGTLQMCIITTFPKHAIISISLPPPLIPFHPYLSLQLYISFYLSSYMIQSVTLSTPLLITTYQLLGFGSCPPLLSSFLPPHSNH